MARRPKHERASVRINPGTLVAWSISSGVLEQIADRVTYKGNGQHKTHIAPDGEWVPALKSGKSKCAKYPVSHWSELAMALRNAVLSRLVSEEFRGEFPARLWAYINGELHEARLTNEMTGEYHGFPLEYEEDYPIDPMGLLRNCPDVKIPTD